MQGERSMVHPVSGLGGDHARASGQTPHARCTVLVRTPSCRKRLPDSIEGEWEQVAISADYLGVFGISKMQDCMDKVLGYLRMWSPLWPLPMRSTRARSTDRRWRFTSEFAMDVAT